jgi:hypothetical protein
MGYPAIILIISKLFWGFFARVTKKFRDPNGRLYMTSTARTIQMVGKRTISVTLIKWRVHRRPDDFCPQGTKRRILIFRSFLTRLAGIAGQV